MANYEQALIGLGANLGDRARTLQSAISALQAHPRIEIGDVAVPVETQAIGGPVEQPDFLNGAAILKTDLTPEELLAELMRVESQLGRVRTGRWEPRTLDLDLLLMGNHVRSTRELILPHPWLPFRDFVLEPTVTIASDWRHPVLDKTIYELRRHLQAIPYWFVLDGGQAERRAALAVELAQAVGGNALIPVGEPREDAEYLSPHETPPLEIYVSSVDWTRADVSAEMPLRLVKPGREVHDGTEVYLRSRRGNRPFPKARFILCETHDEILSMAEPERTSIFEMMSPIPTLRLDARDDVRALSDALAAIGAMTPSDSLR